MDATFATSDDLLDNQEFGLKEPTGVAFDRLGNILVADRGSMKIEVFAMNGLYLRSMALTYSPVGIDLDRDSETLYVADTTHRAIFVYKL